jgi:hypothetical protein
MGTNGQEEEVVKASPQYLNYVKVKNYIQLCFMETNEGNILGFN